jgi:hypothetical protein
VGACLKARKGYLISIDRSNYTVTKLPYSHGYEVRERERERERERKDGCKSFFSAYYGCLDLCGTVRVRIGEWRILEFRR